MVTVGHVAYPYLYTALIAVAYGLMLPAIAILHPRHGRHRESGTILATITGNATVTVGIGGSVNVDLHPAALFVLGMWWWTIGKLWAETEILPRRLGVATALIGVFAMAGSFLAAVSAALGALAPHLPDVAVWSIFEVILGGWLIVLGVTFWRMAAAHLPSD